MAEIKVGQRYWLYPWKRGGFIAEVTRVVNPTVAELKVLQDTGYCCGVGTVWPHEHVLESSNYELLVGQESPTT